MVAFGIDLVLGMVLVLLVLVAQEQWREAADPQRVRQSEANDQDPPPFYLRFLQSVGQGAPEPLLLNQGVNREPGVAAAAILGLPWLFGLLFHAWLGRSPGKALLGLRTYTASGEPIPLGKASVRYFGKWMSALPLFLGYFMAFAGGKALHDRMNATMVDKA